MWLLPVLPAPTAGAQAPALPCRALEGPLGYEFSLENCHGRLSLDGRLPGRTALLATFRFIFIIISYLLRAYLILDLR